ncbi:hypothetical protein [Rhodohalobacter sulfatireducens]|uniref:Uncharacterized protein n=1 Tax=Rhodohalobacter sulfatireducens TaxID=2911366 RepID=A0ABS9KIV9_9BACT|nr:hypothetical protein [Rhodohalobacter sulfatireducens]MCG2590766.1 hypothetical protein [Rhodohalobacter sulfatireducens]
MNYKDKIRTLKTYLYQAEDNYRDSFKTDICLFFNDDFTVENPMLIFLKEFDNRSEIKEWVDLVTRQIVLKFDEEYEEIGNFIGEFIELKNIES